MKDTDNNDGRVVEEIVGAPPSEKKTVAETAQKASKKSRKQEYQQLKKQAKKLRKEVDKLGQKLTKLKKAFKKAKAKEKSPEQVQLLGQKIQEYEGERKTLKDAFKAMRAEIKARKDAA